MSGSFKWAKVVLTDGTKLRIVRVHDDGKGVRFYANNGPKVVLIAAVPGMRVKAWGGYGPRNPDGSRGPKQGAVLDGSLPYTFASLELLQSCGCGNPLKAFRPPNEWEAEALTAHEALA